MVKRNEIPHEHKFLKNKNPWWKGIDTTHYRVDSSLPEIPIEVGAGKDLPWQAVWRNPEGYEIKL